MMEKLGYDFTKKSGLNFDKEKQALFCSFVPKDKDPNYYQKTRRGLGYVTTSVSSDSESAKEVYHDSSSVTSSWDSDVSIGDIFGSLSVNMASTNHLKDEEEDTFESKEFIQSDFDP